MFNDFRFWQWSAVYLVRSFQWTTRSPSTVTLPSYTYFVVAQLFAIFKIGPHRRIELNDWLMSHSPRYTTDAQNLPLRCNICLQSSSFIEFYAI